MRGAAQSSKYEGLKRNNGAPSPLPPPLTQSGVPALPLLALPPLLQPAHRLCHVLRRAGEGDAHPPLAWYERGGGVVRGEGSVVRVCSIMVRGGVAWNARAL